MPTYVYENEELGIRTEVQVPFSKRKDHIVLQLVPAMPSVNTGALSRTDTPMGDRLQEGYAKLEDRGQDKPMGSTHMTNTAVKAALQSA